MILDQRNEATAATEMMSLETQAVIYSTLTSRKIITLGFRLGICSIDKEGEPGR